MRQAFIDSAVRVVARDGLVKATTKAIAAEAGLNEAYIYKCFSNKDDLLSVAFHQEDENFARLLQGIMPIMHMPDFTWRERSFLLWKQSWEFILKKEDDCLFYIRYYYSAECRMYAYEKHLEFFRNLIETFSTNFKTSKHIEILMHQMFDTMLAFALRVLNGEMENNEETIEWTFEQIYCFVVPNVRPEILKEEDRKETI